MDNNRPIVWETIDLLISKNSPCETLRPMSTKVDVIVDVYVEFLEQTSKFTMIGIDNWCNIFDVADVSFFSKW